VTRRPRYAFRGRDGVLQALARAHIIESWPTERTASRLHCRIEIRRRPSALPSAGDLPA
jgi:transposase